MPSKYTNEEKLKRIKARLEKLKANAEYGRIGSVLFYDYVSAYPKIDAIDTEGVEVSENLLPPKESW